MVKFVVYPKSRASLKVNKNTLFLLSNNFQDAKKNRFSDAKQSIKNL